jgi:hypothetical protein
LNIYHDTCIEIATKLGLKLKEVVFDKPIEYGGKPTILGHSTEWIYVFVDQQLLVIPVVMRPDERLYGKLLLNANLENKMTTTAREITLSKCLSYIYMLWGMPEVVILCSIITLQVAAKQPNTESDNPYSWNSTRIPLNGFSYIKPFISSTGIVPMTDQLLICNPNRTEYQLEAFKMFKEILLTYNIPEILIDKMMVSCQNCLVFDYKILFKILDDASVSAYKRRTGEIKQYMFTQHEISDSQLYITHNCSNLQLMVDEQKTLSYLAVRCTVCLTRDNVKGKHPIIVGRFIPHHYKEHDQSLHLVMTVMLNYDKKIVGQRIKIKESFSTMGISNIIVLFDNQDNYDKLMHAIKSATYKQRTPLSHTVKLIDKIAEHMVTFKTTSDLSKNQNGIYRMAILNRSYLEHEDLTATDSASPSLVHIAACTLSMQRLVRMTSVTPHYNISISDLIVEIIKLMEKLDKEIKEGKCYIAHHTTSENL